MAKAVKNRIQKTMTWVMVLLALFAVVAVPTGGKCVSYNGALCVLCPDLPCLDEGGAASNGLACGVQNQRTVADLSDCSDCRFIAYENAPGKSNARLNAPVFAFVAIVPPLSAFTVPRTVAVGTAYFPTGPPAPRRVPASPSSPRAPPFFS